jgi:hypothetical protein
MRTPLIISRLLLVEVVDVRGVYVFAFTGGRGRGRRPAGWPRAPRRIIILYYILYNNTSMQRIHSNLDGFV